MNVIVLFHFSRVYTEKFGLAFAKKTEKSYSATVNICFLAALIMTVF